MCDVVEYPHMFIISSSLALSRSYSSICINHHVHQTGNGDNGCRGRGFTALRCTCMYYIIEHVRRNMAEEVEGTSEKLRLKIRTTRRSEDVEVAPDCTVKEVG